MTVSEELWQGCTEAGEPIVGQGITKRQAAEGALHLASHVWIWRESNDGIEILVQKRAADKPTWPGFLDISAAGHVDFGESPLQAALREAYEELGVRLDAGMVRFIFAHRAFDALPNEIIENEIVWVYGVNSSVEVGRDLSDEVESWQWINLQKFKELVKDDSGADRFVPHGDAYFEELFKEIQRLSS